METLNVLRKMYWDNWNKGVEIYFVGGFVRDGLLKLNANDLDIVIKGMSKNDIISFLKKYGKVKQITLSQTNTKFSVTTILFTAFNEQYEAPYQVQITLPRRGKKQISKFNNTLEQDCKHRDFKMNCLYLPITYTSPNFANIIDLVGGIKDIKKRIITANGNPYERIRESPIRMLRAISLAGKLNFSIDIDLLNAISDCAYLLKKVPTETIRIEFDKIIMSDKPSRYLKLMQRLGLLSIISPELENCVNVSQDKKYHKHDVFDHLIFTCDNIPKNLVLRLAALLHDVGKPKVRVQKEKSKRITFHKHEIESVKETKTFMSRLRYETDIKKDVLALIRMHMYHYTREWTDAAVRRFIKNAKLGPKHIGQLEKFPLFILRAAERLGNGLKKNAVTDRQLDFQKRLEAILKTTTTLNIKDLSVNGNDLKEIFNIPENKQMGEMLIYLLNKALEDQTLNTRKKLLKLAAEKLVSGGFGG